MRALIVGSLCLVAACSEGEQPKKEEAAAAKVLEAGRWETSFEVTSIRSTDNSTPVVKAKAGDKSTALSCIPTADKPDPEMFAGEGYDCDYKTSHIRSGRIVAQLSCRRTGVKGEIMMTVDGDYDANGFTGTVSSTSFLPGTGDFAMNRKLTGKKTADTCAASGAQEKSGQSGG